MDFDAYAAAWKELGASKRPKRALAAAGAGIVGSSAGGVAR